MALKLEATRMTGESANSTLVEEFRGIRKNHKKALQTRVARTILAPSIMRVFQAGTKHVLFDLLSGMDLESLRRLRGEDAFRRWFEDSLARVASRIKKRNPTNDRIYPGDKWGHGAKVLTVFVKNIVFFSRCFNEREIRRIQPWLYAPLDSIVIKRLRRLGVRLPFRHIKEIDSARKFCAVQDELGRAARQARVPRILFDDIWGDRP